MGISRSAASQGFCTKGKRDAEKGKHGIADLGGLVKDALPVQGEIGIEAEKEDGAGNDGSREDAESGPVVAQVFSAGNRPGGCGGQFPAGNIPVEDGRRAQGNDGEGRRAGQAETAQRQGIPERYAAHGQQHNQRADDKTAVAAHGKDAQTHALVITGNKVGITRAFGMEDGPADAAEHERGEDGPVGVKKADGRQPEAGQQDAQRNEPAAREFVGYKSENRLNDGGHGRIGKGQRAAGLIIEIVGGCQIRKQGRQGPAVDVAGEMSQRYQKNFFELHAGRILCENDENSNAAGKAAPAASVVA